MRKVILATALFVLCSAAAIGQAAPSHVVMVILENKPYEEMVGNPNLPYINSLVNHPKAAVMTQSYALTRPSQPNYFMLFSGSDQGVAHNNNPAGLPYHTPNIAASLRSAGYSFTGYAEDLPYVGFADSAHLNYVRKHNPWVNWQGTGLNTIPDSCNRPWSDFPSNYHQLPTFSIVIPNQLNDMHSGPTTVADAWLRDSLGAYVNWCVNNNSLFILTFDEDNNSGLFNNHILTLFIGANTAGGFQNQHVTHYNVLRTLEQLYQLPYSGHSADSSAIPGIWNTALPINLSRLEAFAEGKQVKLVWESQQSSTTSSYEVQRSVNNGQSYVSIGAVASATSQSFVDVQPHHGLNIYRLKAIDRNGSISFSKAVSVNMLQLPANDFIISPNPFKDQVNVLYKGRNRLFLAVELVDASGNIVRKQLEQVVTQQTFTMKLSSLPSGSYYLRINAEGKTLVKQLQKQ